MANKQVIQALQSQIDGILSQENGAETRKGCSPVKKAHAQASGHSEEQDRLSDSNAALKKIIALVNASDKSELAIRQRLENDGFNEAAVEESVEQAKVYGFIDDARYAQVLIRSRIAQCKGSAGIVRELAENGIVADEVDGWPYEFPISHEDELDRAIDLLDRKPPHSKNMREGAYRRLMQKGYPSSVASSAARIWSEKR